MTTSPENTRASKTSDPAATATVVASEVRYGIRFLRGQGWRVLAVFLGVLVPLLVFAELVDELQQNKVFFFDEPLMLALHQFASPGIDRFFVVMSELGYKWGVIPVDVGLLAWLAWHRRYRDGLFFGLAVIGSLLLNLSAKNYFGRMRPELWLSLAPETTFSFPSGHAMGSVTLGVALILLFWPTRARWRVLAVAGLFVVLVGASRVYLGVHFPSDIFAGWTAGTAWVFAMYYLVAHRAPKPPQEAGVKPAHDLIEDAGKAPEHGRGSAAANSA